MYPRSRYRCPGIFEFKIIAFFCQGSTAGKNLLEEILVQGNTCQNRPFGNHPLRNPESVVHVTFTPYNRGIRRFSCAVCIPGFLLSRRFERIMVKSGPRWKALVSEVSSRSTSVSVYLCFFLGGGCWVVFVVKQLCCYRRCFCGCCGLCCLFECFRVFSCLCPCFESCVLVFSYTFCFDCFCFFLLGSGYSFGELFFLCIFLSLLFSFCFVWCCLSLSLEVCVFWAAWPHPTLVSFVFCCSVKQRPCHAV